MISRARTIFFLGVIALLPTLALAQTLSNEYYQLIEFQGIDPTRVASMDTYLERALLPAWNRMGIQNVGVLQRAAVDDAGKTSLFLLIPLENPNQLPALLEELGSDHDFLEQGRVYLETDPKQPLYSRIRSELLLAFDSFPKLKVPPQKEAGKSRLFELRVYESPTEMRGYLKVEMFNSGEVPIFLNCGIQPVFMGQALVGDKLPNLTYMTVYDNAQQRDECWKKFREHPQWKVLSSDPKYIDTVSKIHKLDLLPRPYSQL